MTFVFFIYHFQLLIFSIFKKTTHACLTIDLSIPARCLLSSQSVRRIGCLLFCHLVRLSISRCDANFSIISHDMASDSSLSPIQYSVVYSALA